MAAKIPSPNADSIVHFMVQAFCYKGAKCFLNGSKSSCLQFPIFRELNYRKNVKCSLSSQTVVFICNLTSFPQYKYTQFPNQTQSVFQVHWKVDCLEFKLSFPKKTMLEMMELVSLQVSEGESTKSSHGLSCL